MDFFELQEQVERHSVPLHLWGQNGAKTLEDLYAEHEAGESRFAVLNGTFTRCIRPLVFCVDGKCPETGYHVALYEAERILADGTDATRQLVASFAEKLRHGERLHAAIARAFKEELDVELSEEELRNVAFLCRTFETEDSGSFPKLPTRRETLWFGTTMRRRHMRSEYVERQPRKTTTFRWKPYAERPWRSQRFIRV